MDPLGGDYATVGLGLDARMENGVGSQHRLPGHDQLFGAGYRPDHHRARQHAFLKGRLVLASHLWRRTDGVTTHPDRGFFRAAGHRRRWTGRRARAAAWSLSASSTFRCRVRASRRANAIAAALATPMARVRARHEGGIAHQRDRSLHHVVGRVVKDGVDERPGFCGHGRRKGGKGGRLRIRPAWPRRHRHAHGRRKEKVGTPSLSVRTRASSSVE